MTKQDFIRKALLLGFMPEFARKAAEQAVEAGVGFDGLLPGLPVALPRRELRPKIRYCPAMQRNLPPAACRETIELLSRKGGSGARRCMRCGHSEWL